MWIEQEHGTKIGNLLSGWFQSFTNRFNFCETNKQTSETDWVLPESNTALIYSCRIMKCQCVFFYFPEMYITFFTLISEIEKWLQIQKKQLKIWKPTQQQLRMEILRKFRNQSKVRHVIVVCTSSNCHHHICSITIHVSVMPAFIISKTSITNSNHPSVHSCYATVELPIYRVSWIRCPQKMF